MGLGLCRGVHRASRDTHCQSNSRTDQYALFHCNNYSHTFSHADPGAAFSHPCATHGNRSTDTPPTAQLQVGERGQLEGLEAFQFSQFNSGTRL
jgi:hypothetical protein